MITLLLFSALNDVADSARDASCDVARAEIEQKIKQYLINKCKSECKREYKRQKGHRGLAYNLPIGDGVSTSGK